MKNVREISGTTPYGDLSAVVHTGETSYAVKFNFRSMSLLKYLVHITF